MEECNTYVIRNIRALRHHITRPNGPENAHFGAENIGWQALAPTITFTSLATFVVALRWYTRFRIVRCAGMDDFVISLSLAISLAMCAVISAAAHESTLGLPSEVIKQETSAITKLIVVANDLWALTVNITKASILMQYLRIFRSQKTRIVCYLLLSALLPAACWAVLGGTLLCSPVAKLWDPRLPGSCLDAQVYWTSVAAVDIGLDFLIIGLPIPAIARLHLPRKQKVSIVMVFLLGFFVCGISVARLATVGIMSDEGEYIISGVWAIIWSAVEANVGIICACLLALRPLLAKLFPNLLEGSDLPRHCMRLPMIESEPITEDTEVTLPVSQSASSAASPTASNSVNGANVLHRLSTAPTIVERPPPAGRIKDPDGKLSMSEMLRDA